MDKVALLRSVPLFADLDGRSLDAVSVLAREIELPAGQVVMLQGDPGDAFYVIAEGTVRVERAGGTARSMTSGGFLGEIALLEGGARTATATCETDCRLLAIQRHEFERLMVAFPHIERRVRQAALRRPHGGGSEAS
ncbi:MAG TPA: cyclic nucleotide-binding domain-containing protein [Candidatus Limnocylindrales bacterium]|nr:cyclic nucleotide-binding domain-containing protein [Candidatus Limnocylindrales bacterium]